MAASATPYNKTPWILMGTDDASLGDQTPDNRHL